MQEQYEAALAKPEDQRNWLERQQVKAGQQREAATAQTPEATVGQATRTYEGEQAMQEGIAQMARQGWRVVSQSSFQPRAGLGRIALLGVGSLIVKPRMKFVVVFERVSQP